MSVSRLLITAGACLILAGLVWSVLGRTGAGAWLGRLPGDVRIEGEHARFYFPLTTCLLLSAIATLLAALARALFHR